MKTLFPAALHLQHFKKEVNELTPHLNHASNQTSNLLTCSPAQPKAPRSVCDLLTLPPFTSFASPSFSTPSPRLLSPHSISTNFRDISFLVTSGSWSTFGRTLLRPSLLPLSAPFILPDRPSVLCTRKETSAQPFNINKTFKNRRGLC